MQIKYKCTGCAAPCEATIQMAYRSYNIEFDMTRCLMVYNADMKPNWKLKEEVYDDFSLKFTKKGTTIVYVKDKFTWNEICEKIRQEFGDDRGRV